MRRRVRESKRVGGSARGHTVGLCTGLLTAPLFPPPHNQPVSKARILSFYLEGHYSDRQSRPLDSRGVPCAYKRASEEAILYLIPARHFENWIPLVASSFQKLFLKDPGSLGAGPGNLSLSRCSCVGVYQGLLQSILARSHCPVLDLAIWGQWQLGYLSRHVETALPGHN